MPDTAMEPLPWITVVSGLPRSGTSLMMQALAAGGLPPLTDELRPADASNPRGYLEYDPVKRLKTDRSWLAQARGRAIKVVHLLLPELARDEGGNEFRVILMRRPMGEILASQRTMLHRQGRPAAQLSDEKLGELFNDQMERVERSLAAHPAFRICTVHYPALVAHPETETARINEFLGGQLDAAAMARAVDLALYRERA
jgi:hypothetical protein